MRFLSLLGFSSRSSEHLSPPPSLTQITSPKFQLHHQLQRPSPASKLVDTRLRFLSGLGAERRRCPTKHLISSSRHHPDGNQITSSVSNLDSKRSPLHTSFASKRRSVLQRIRKKNSPLQPIASSAQVIEKKPQIIVTRIKAPDSTSRPTPSRPRTDSHTESLSPPAKRRLRHKKYSLGPVDVPNSHQDHPASLSRLSPPIPPVPPLILYRECPTAKCNSNQSTARDCVASEYNAHCDSQESLLYSLIDLTTLSIPDLATLERATQDLTTSTF